MPDSRQSCRKVSRARLAPEEHSPGMSRSQQATFCKCLIVARISLTETAGKTGPWLPCGALLAGRRRMDVSCKKLEESLKTQPTIQLTQTTVPLFTSGITQLSAPFFHSAGIFAI